MNCKFIRWILGVLGFTTVAASCEVIDEIGGGGQVCMYGCPSADYVFDVDVVDSENDTPIEGIRVSAIEKVEHQYWDSETGMATYDTVTDTLAVGTTDASGKVVLNINSFPSDKHTIVADDVDGDANGKFDSASVVLTTNSDDYKEPGEYGWYSGTATHDVTLKLNKKTE